MKGCLRALLCAFTTFVGLIDLAAAPQSPRPRRIVWSGEEIYESAYAYGGRVRPSIGIPAEYSSLIRISFKYVQEFDESGGGRWSRQQINWTAVGSSVAPGYTTVTCSGSGSVDLTKVSADEATKRLTIPCTKTDFATYAGFFNRPPDRVKVPKIVDWEDLRGDCSYSEERPGYRYTVSVAPDVDAMIELDPDPSGDYGSFVPEPGRKLIVSARTIGGPPARFRFVLEDVSRFPGYATNANVDPAFFEWARLPRLAGRYTNEGPDLVFDPADFEDASQWTMSGYDVVETVQEDSSASATVTAVDFGAIGRLRAYMRAGCGAWMPVRVRLGGQDRSAVGIPLDEDDNLIADALAEYRGDPGRDDDAEPAGDGTAGDGLTAFEEYRAMLTQGGDCARREHDVPVRTDPTRKDLFIHGATPDLVASIPYVGWASDVTVHPICERHYSGNPPDATWWDTLDTRVVNFTLQAAGLRQWRGKTISGEFAQRGLYVSNRPPPPGASAIACSNPPSCSLENIGPPVVTVVVIMPENQGPFINHEVGHAMGIPHHGDTVDRGWWGIKPGKRNIGGLPLLIEPGDNCADPRTGAPRVGTTVPLYDGDTFLGCGAWDIRVRGGENSGRADCPMRYVGGDLYEAPGSSAVSTRLIELPGSTTGFEEMSLRGSWLFDGYRGRLLPYRTDLDDQVPRPGTYCSSPAGTHLNALPGDQNHTGDAASGGCRKHIIVNDALVFRTHPRFRPDSP